MKISVIGTGYVGLVSGAVFADWGHDVVCLDVNSKKIEMINKGVMPIYEDGLEELVKKVIKEGRFKAVTNYKNTIEHGEVIFICVGTPSNQSGAADLNYVFSASQSIGENIPLGSYKIIVTKSTVPVGTHEKVKGYVSKGLQNKKAKFDIVSNPEFLREGSSIYDANNTDRVVLGSDSKKALDIMETLYKHLGSPIIKTDLASAELIKYAANAFLATKISFINEISQICERTGADVKDVSYGMGMDSRIGLKFLNAGIGYGGSCFPKDVEALYRTSSEKMYDFRLLRGVIDANDRQKTYFMDKVWRKYGGNLSKKTFSVLGVAFKNGTDDVRKSVALAIVQMLRGAGSHIKLFDPAAMKNAKLELGEDNIEYCENKYVAMKESDGILILTEWAEFGEIDLSRAKKLLKTPVIFDGRNMLNPSVVKEAGFEYHGIGRNNS